MTSKLTVRWGAVGRHLKECLATRKWTFKTAEQYLGVGRYTLNHIATGHGCSVETYLTICSRLGWNPMSAAFVKQPEGR